ncbi:Phage terminase large subunit [compost metagenome]
MHLPANDLIADEDELQQLTSERKKWVIVKGARVMRWDAGGRRNEALDCAVYALAALRISQQRFGLDLDLLAEQLPDANLSEPEDGDTTAPVPASVPTPQAHQPTPPAEPGGWFDSGQDAWL